MWLVFFSNLPELALGGLWTGTMIYLGYKLGRSRERRKWERRPELLTSQDH